MNAQKVVKSFKIWADSKSNEEKVMNITEFDKIGNIIDYIFW